jgi:YHS domain-containing protein
MSMTGILNIVFLMIALVLFLIYLTGKEEKEADRLVEDPVCGNDVLVKSADYCYMYEETIYYFDSEECRDQFRENPESFLDNNQETGSVQ